MSDRSHMVNADETVVASSLPTLEALRDEYGRSLSRKLREVKDTVERGALGDARHLAHRLHGSAGSYGFLSVSHAAGRVEHAITLLEAGSVAQRDATLKEILRTLEAAASWMDYPPAATPPRPMAVRADPVLVVDDDPAFLQHVRRIDRGQHLDIVVAKRVSDAIERAKKGTLKAAIIALELGGRRDTPALLARTLRGIPGYARLPLVFTSAEGGLDERLAASAAGATSCMTKPIALDALASTVRRLIDLRALPSARVLVVDDDQDFCGYVAALLANAGMNVGTICDPSRTLESLAETRPDLLIVDLEMPGSSGLDLCRVIRASPRWQSLPVLLLTARTGVDMRMMAYSAGADDYMAKPFSDHELVARVEQRVARTRAVAACDRAAHAHHVGLSK